MSEEIKSAWQAILAAGILGGIFGALLTSVLTHWLTSKREKRAGIKAEKLKIIPILDGYILGVQKDAIRIYGEAAQAAAIIGKTNEAIRFGIAAVTLSATFANATNAASKAP